MNKTFLIFKHEFKLETKRISYLIMTLIVPGLFLLAIGIAALVVMLSNPTAKDIKEIGYVDEVGTFNDQTTQGMTKLIPYASKKAATQALLQKEITEFFLIPADYLATATVQRYILEKELVPPPNIIGMINKFIAANLLKDKMPPDMVTLIVSPPNLEVTRLNEKGERAIEQGHYGNAIIPFVFSLLLGLGLMLGASSLIAGLGEEKESRLIEVFLTSVSGKQLLIGKIMALGIAGLLQVLIWLASAPLLLYLASSASGGALEVIQIPRNFLVLGVVYFILGYLLFAVLSVGISAIATNSREGGKMSLIYTLSAFAPLWFSSLLFAFPNSPVWAVFSIFPITAPIQTMLRMGVTDIPLWQIITSISVMIISIFAGLYLSIKIFRIYILMHGRRPTIKEIIRNMKSA